MPEISRFYGIVIKMYFPGNEHNPPHIHAVYQGYIVAISIIDLDVIAGGMAPKALSMINEWIEIHREELLEMWNSHKIKKIEPLK